MIQLTDANGQRVLASHRRNQAISVQVSIPGRRTAQAHRNTDVGRERRLPVVCHGSHAKSRSGCRARRSFRLVGREREPRAQPKSSPTLLASSRNLASIPNPGSHRAERFEIASRC